jgi:hypothetical protein
MVADHQGVGDQGAVNHEIGCALCILQSRSNILLVSTSALGQFLPPTFSNAAAEVASTPDAKARYAVSLSD